MGWFSTSLSSPLVVPIATIMVIDVIPFLPVCYPISVIIPAWLILATPLPSGFRHGFLVLCLALLRGIRGSHFVHRNRCLVTDRYKLKNKKINLFFFIVFFPFFSVFFLFFTFNILFYFSNHNMKLLQVANTSFDKCNMLFPDHL